MTVAELIQILQSCEQNMVVATHACNHDDFGGQTRVHLMRTYQGPRVLIGNPSKKHLNPPNWEIEHALDGGPELKKEWPR